MPALLLGGVSLLLLRVLLLLLGGLLPRLGRTGVLAWALT
jgi:hypothetical protein